jgi:uncharacterized protein
MGSTPAEHWVPVEGGVSLHAWVYRPVGIPSGAGGSAITMAHGFGGLKHRSLVPFAECFARAGFTVIVHDHREFGLSGGWPRMDIDPWQQIHDWRRVITYLQELDGADPRRIGIWGTSFAGGHALILGGSEAAQLHGAEPIRITGSAWIPAMTRRSLSGRCSGRRSTTRGSGPSGSRRRLC